MCVKRGVRETFAFVLAEEPTFAESYVINLVAGTSAIQFHPRLIRLLPFSVKFTSSKYVSGNIQTLTTLFVPRDFSYFSRSSISHAVLKHIILGIFGVFSYNSANIFITFYIYILIVQVRNTRIRCK